MTAWSYANKHTLIFQTSYFFQTPGSVRETHARSEHQTSKPVDVFSTREHGHNLKHWEMIRERERRKEYKWGGVRSEDRLTGEKKQRDGLENDGGECVNKWKIEKKVPSLYLSIISIWKTNQGKVCAHNSISHLLCMFLFVCIFRHINTLSSKYVSFRHKKEEIQKTGWEYLMHIKRIKRK